MLKNATYLGRIVFYENEIDVRHSVDEFKWVEDFQFLFSTFHATEISIHTEEDDYFAGIRADHFVIEEGWSEAEGFVPGKAIVIVTANHKGIRTSTAWRLNL
ncbi:hypothetical protein [Enterococcus gilvus]|uniref:hypothetical protein n=1 Tax=Enterococcus gilvus TaxID=160453 RepID=UPI001C8BA787|nr:hypothetical protein [Enterococcus gilvus]MBX8938509.1 hypothetical protein [Enterococcus gilvus]